MLLKSPKLIQLLKDLLHNFDPFNFIVETDEEREALPVTEADVSKLCKVKSDESIWMLKNFADKGLVWESISGLNAYELDKKYNNFQGTLAEWFEHWRGYSAFEVWQQFVDRPEATEEDYIKHITGPAGDGTTVFTLEEKKTSKVWTNKKVIWRKVINIGQFVKTSNKPVPHGIVDIETPVSVYGVAVNNADSKHICPVPYANNTSTVVYQANNTNVTVYCNGDWTNWSGLAILEYTKSTDLPLTDEEIKALEIKSGAPGKSVYDIAKENGYTGTEAEYYEFLSNSAEKNILIYGASEPKIYTPVINYQSADPLNHISDQTKFTYNTATYTREGKYLVVNGTFVSTVAGTGGRTDIFLPLNLTIDNVHEYGTYSSAVGKVNRLGVADGNEYYIVAKTDRTFVTIHCQNGAGNNFNISANYPYSYWFRVPIKEWEPSKFLDEVIDTTVGASAYEIAVKNGFEGTEAEWLESLSGYGVAKENGFIGTEEEWIQAMTEKTQQQLFAFTAGTIKDYEPEIENVLVTESKANYVREGKYLFVRGIVTFASAFTSQLKIHLPDNLEIDGIFETETDHEKFNVVGQAYTIPYASSNWFGVNAKNGDNWVTFRRGDNFSFNNNSYSGYTFSYWFKVPIKNWFGSKLADQVWDGTVGDSAYDLAVKNGFEGTEQEWLDTLDGYGVAKSVGFTGTKEEWIAAISEQAKTITYNYTAGTKIEYVPEIENVLVTENGAAYWREGKNIYIRGYVTFSTGFTGQLKIHLPDGLTFELDTVENASATLVDNNIIGSAITSPAWNYPIRVCASNGSSYFTLNRPSDNWLFNSSTLVNYTLFYELKAPITEWEGSLLGDQVWDGTVGKSAYEIATKNGFEGTEEEWLESLTTFNLAKEQGFTGTKAEWVEALTKNAEKTFFSYSASNPVQFTPEWENVNALYTNAQYWREGKFLCVQGYAKFNSNATAKIKFYIPNKDELTISGLMYETETTNSPCLVGNAQYYYGAQKYIYYVNATNETNYVTFRRIGDDFNNNLGSTAINLTGIGFTFFFKVPIKTWQGTQVLDQIWDGTVGLSAYELAVKNGFEGTETEWLNTLDAYETAKKRSLIASDATVEDWYKQLSLYGLAVKYDGFTGTMNEYLALFRTSVLPEGGTQGQVLVKQSADKDDAEWQNIIYPGVTYLHTQEELSNKWVIEHNLNTTEQNYIVKDTDEELVLCDINLEESTANKLVLEFREPQNGTCLILARTDKFVPVQTKHIMVDRYSEKVIDHGDVNTALNIYVTDAPIQKFTLAGNTNVQLYNWGSDGRSFAVTLMFFSKGAFKLNFVNSIKWSNGSAPGFNMTASSSWRVTLTSDDGGNTIYGFVNGFNFA